MGTTYVPTPVGSGFRQESFWDTELSAIASELANKVDRNGVAPNAMAAELDMGTHKLLNVVEGVAGTDGVNVTQLTNVATSIATSILSGGGAGQGQTTGDPITFNFGLAVGSQGTGTRTVFDLNVLFGVTSFLGLTVVVNGVVQTPGLAYTISDETTVTFTESLNTDSDIMFIYGDLSPTPVFTNVNATLVETTATATPGQTVFTAPTYVIAADRLMVHIDGLMQSVGFGDYTETSTTSITLDEPMVGGERVVIREITGS
jgi:hypothetical protein